MQRADSARCPVFRLSWIQSPDNAVRCARPRQRQQWAIDPGSLPRQYLSDGSGTDERLRATVQVVADELGIDGSSGATGPRRRTTA